MLLISLILNVSTLAAVGQIQGRPPSAAEKADPSELYAYAPNTAKMSPTAVLDLAQSYETKGERAWAAYYYRLYLRRAPSAPNGLLIAERIGEALFAELSRGRGLLEVESPKALLVKVDGQVYPTLPVVVFLPVGEHDLELAFADHSEQKRVAVRTGRPTTLLVEPKEETARVPPPTRASVQKENPQARSSSPRWVVIGHPRMKGEIDEDRLRDAFSGRRVVSQDGEMIQTVLGPRGSSARVAFLSDFLGKTETGFRAAWTKVVFRGNDAVPPLELSDEAAVIRAVTNRPGTLGIVSADVATDGVTRVKINLR